MWPLSLNEKVKYQKPLYKKKPRIAGLQLLQRQITYRVLHRLRHLFSDKNRELFLQLQSDVLINLLLVIL